jgi:hypothetical protein
MSLPDLKDVLPILLGFFSGWGLSELTEGRKRRRARRALRQALLVELERTEVRMNTTVTKYAYLASTVPQVARVASEARWFLKEGMRRAPSANVVVPEGFEGKAEALAAQPDANLVAIFAARIKETVGSAYLCPVLDSALSGSLQGFSVEQIQALSELRSQIHMLGQEAEWTQEMWRQTFTVNDKNYPVVVANHENRVRAYALRAEVVLDCTRAAIVAFGGTATYPVR